MKTYGITLIRGNAYTEILTRANSMSEAADAVCAAEKLPSRAVAGMRIIPTAKQIARTKNLMRCL